MFTESIGPSPFMDFHNKRCAEAINIFLLILNIFLSNSTNTGIKIHDFFQQDNDSLFIHFQSQDFYVCPNLNWHSFYYKKEIFRKFTGKF